jgi:O-acetylhomoserine (thiol)-lyase
MPAPKPPAFETLSLHAGQHPDPVIRSRAVPIYQTTSYMFDDADHAGLFNLERAGHSTRAFLIRRLQCWKNGSRRSRKGSARSAPRAVWRRCISPSRRSLAPATISSPPPSLYGGSINLLTHTLPRFGVTTTFVKPRDLDGLRAAVRPNTRLVIAETIGNPGLECSIFRRSPRSPTRPAFRSSSTIRLPRRI